MMDPYESPQDWASPFAPPQHRFPATVTVGEESATPKICCTCGEPSKRVRRIVRREAEYLRRPRHHEETSVGPWLLTFLLCGIPGLLFAATAWMGTTVFGNKSIAKFKIPITKCKTCAKQGSVTPIDVDFNHFKMTFEVHPDYKTHWDNLN